MSERVAAAEPLPAPLPWLARPGIVVPLDCAPAQDEDSGSVGHNEAQPTGTTTEVQTS